MRKLFFKIFAIFWIAQSLIFAISTLLIVRHRFPHPGSLYDSLSASLILQGQHRVADFELDGCPGFYAGTDPVSVALGDEGGQPLCGSPARTTPEERVPDNHATGIQLKGRYLWQVPITSASERRYIFQFSTPHQEDDFSLRHELLHFSFPQLPVAIAISGLVTFLLTFLFTQRVAKLRTAARALAEGNLSTRVPIPSSVPLGGKDEFQALSEDFNHMAERLESLVQAHKLLVRDVSHELRSPLARLSVALELAREDAEMGKIEHLERIEREAERLNQLINQLLTLSSMEFIEERPRNDVVCLTDVVEEVVADADFEAQLQGCLVNAELEADCSVLGDRELLHRAIENIVRNAIRYTSPGTTVDVTLASAVVDSRSTAVLKVRDHGPGIPDNEAQNVLKPFYRLDPARSRFTGGFGVGLAITERVVKLHDGQLTISNSRSGGAVLRMLLPLFESQAPPVVGGS